MAAPFEKSDICQEGIVLEPPRGVVLGIWSEGTSFVDLDRNDSIEVLGRPIRLADVLLALNETRKDKTFKKTMSEIEALLFHNPFRWNFRNDDLSAQSEKTISFLAGLLK
jgi:hypothetical protein